MIVDESFKFIWEKILPIFSMFLCHIFSFGSSGLNCRFIHREYDFSINSKISFMRTGDKPILTMKISVNIFFRFQYFAGFDKKNCAF